MVRSTVIIEHVAIFFSPWFWLFEVIMSLLRYLITSWVNRACLKGLLITKGYESGITVYKIIVLKSGSLWILQLLKIAFFCWNFFLVRSNNMITLDMGVFFIIGSHLLLDRISITIDNSAAL